MRNTRLTLLHMITGVFIAALLGIHMVIAHLDDILIFFGVEAADPTSWESMMGRASQGIWTGLYVALLALVLYHGLYGLRGIILEVTSSARIARIITRAFIVIGISTFAWGTYVSVALFSS